MTILETEEIWHIPVLYEEILQNLNLFENRKNVVVDTTLWLWWHAIWVLDKLNDSDIFIWFDADEENLNKAKERIESFLKKTNKNIKSYFVHSNFSNIAKKIAELKIDNPTHIYYDFWVNSVHYDVPEKWFSFRFDWPLDLRFDRSKWITAKDIVNTYSEADLRKIFYSFWEEKKTPFIVNAILATRKIKPIETTLELASLIEKSSFDPKSKTRVFQALRIEANKEFDVIKESLENVIDILEKSWIIACITFHSLEDRLIKEIFAWFTKEKIDDFTWQTAKLWIAKKITKKPLIPTEKEIQRNPRSRSAKLRIIQKL